LFSRAWGFDFPGAFRFSWLAPGPPARRVSGCFLGMMRLAFLIEPTLQLVGDPRIGVRFCQKALDVSIWPSGHFAATNHWPFSVQRICMTGIEFMVALAFEVESPWCRWAASCSPASDPREFGFSGHRLF
jgi:hypothetical protein